MQGSTMGSLIKEIGWTKLFLNGLPLRIVMVGTLTGLQWGIYDAYKACAPHLARSWHQIRQSAIAVSCCQLSRVVQSAAPNGDLILML